MKVPSAASRTRVGQISNMPLDVGSYVGALEGQRYDGIDQRLDSHSQLSVGTRTHRHAK